jgi:hypothetical protein
MVSSAAVGYRYAFLMALPAHSGPRPLFQFRNNFFTDCRTSWKGDQRLARPLPTHRATRIQNKHNHTPNIHALSGIRTHNPSIRRSEDSSWLRQRGYCGYLRVPPAPLALQPNSRLGRLHETFRFTSVTRSRTVGRTPWTADQHVARHTQHKH